MLRTLLRVDDAGVAEAVFAVACLVDRLVDVAAADEGQEGHHLLDGHERVASRRSRRTAARCRGGHCVPGRLGQHGGVFAQEVLAGHVVPLVAFAGLDDGGGGQPVDFAAVEPHGAGPLHGLHHRVEDLVDDEDLLLGDAQQVVVVRRRLE